MVSSTKGNIWVLGDFNFPHFLWDDNTSTIKAEFKYTNLYEDFISILDDHNLTQMVTEQTRGENILDLFLTNNPTLVKKINILPGIVDHDIVYTEVSIRPQTNRQIPRIMPIVKRADLDGFSQHMSSFKTTFLNHHEDKSVNLL